MSSCLGAVCGFVVGELPCTHHTCHSFAVRRRGQLRYRFEILVRLEAQRDAECESRCVECSLN